MSRPIKFRYACKDLGGEVFFYYLNLDEILNGFKGFGAMGRIEEIIGRDQFTGLKDRNGREIYEGDIVVYRRNLSIYRPLPYDSYSEVCFGEYAFGEYENACHGYGWYLKDITDRPDGACIAPDTSDLYEVAGNIHQNAELLQ